MPRGDGTGSTGRNAGCRHGSGMGGGSRFHDPGGQCICPECGEKVAHIRGQQCSKQKCPQCGCLMTREHNVDAGK